MQQKWQLVKDLGLGAIPILQLQDSLTKDSKPTKNYVVLIISSCLIATFGLLINSAAVIIGAMIIAPLMLPLRGFSFATLEGDLKLLRYSTISIATGTGFALICSALVGLVIDLPEFGSEVLSRTQPTLIDLLIAITAGGVSGYAKIRPSMGDAIPGTAIAVALMPPLCVVGLCLSQGDWGAAGGAALLYITNLIGINLACIAVYVLSGYARSNELTRTLSWGVSFALIFMLIIPLGASFWKLTRQTQAEASIRRILTTDSLINRSDIIVTDSEVTWRDKPPSLKLLVRSEKSISPEEVKQVETLLENEIKQPFKVIFDVTPSQLVEAN